MHAEGFVEVLVAQLRLLDLLPSTFEMLSLEFMSSWMLCNGTWDKSCIPESFGVAVSDCCSLSMFTLPEMCTGSYNFMKTHDSGKESIINKQRTTSNWFEASKQIKAQKRIVVSTDIPATSTRTNSLPLRDWTRRSLLWLVNEIVQNACIFTLYFQLAKITAV